jgi:hypothetical protein
VGAFLAAVPLLALPVLFYNFTALMVLEGGFGALNASARFAEPVVTVPMASGAPVGAVHRRRAGDHGPVRAVHRAAEVHLQPRHGDREPRPVDAAVRDLPAQFLLLERSRRRPSS